MQAGELPHDCSQCRKSDEYRATHGCDAETEHPQAIIDCPTCGGTGCDECDDTGHMVFKRCPRRLVDAEISQILMWCSGVEVGILPFSGGFAEQPHWFAVCHRHYCGVRSDMAEKERKRHEREIKKRQGR